MAMRGDNEIQGHVGILTVTPLGKVPTPTILIAADFKMLCLAILVTSGASGYMQTTLLGMYDYIRNKQEGWEGDADKSSKSK